MEWFSALSERESTSDAIDEAVGRLREGLGNERPDLVFLFASPDHMTDYAELSATLLDRLPAGALIGCSGGGIVGGGMEVEQRHALSVTAARLDGVTITTHRLDGTLPESAAAWYRRLGFDASAEPSFVLLPDPFSFDAEACLASLDLAFPNAPKVGGIASGSSTPGGNALFLDRDAYGDGAVLLALRGNIVMEPIIAQGCRPIGDPMLVSSCDGNTLLGLDQKPPGAILRQLHSSLSERDQDLMRRALFLGVEMRDQIEYVAGDFLIRNIVGLHENGNAMVIAAQLRQWQAVQFHVRDAAASASDLALQLDKYRDRVTGSAEGALLFSCLGRGEYLYGRAGHDSEIFRDKVGGVALGGFFCNGEIGPVAERTYIHGYTSAFAVFHEKHAAH